MNTVVSRLNRLENYTKQLNEILNDNQKIITELTSKPKDEEKTEEKKNE